jgi:hypothetical protein
MQFHPMSRRTERDQIIIIIAIHREHIVEFLKIIIGYPARTLPAEIDTSLAGCLCGSGIRGFPDMVGMGPRRIDLNLRCQTVLFYQVSEHPLCGR